MQTGKWIVPGQLNSITYKIKLPSGEIKEGALRYTVSQRNRFQELVKKEAEEGSKKIDLAHLALNPVADEENFSADEIESALDLDQIQLLGQIWLDKKVVSPKLTPELDPDWF